MCNGEQDDRDRDDSGGDAAGLMDHLSPPDGKVSDSPAQPNTVLHVMAQIYTLGKRIL